MTYPIRPRRKINAPKRYEDKKEDKEEIHKKTCSICQMLINTKDVISFEINNKIYCYFCYNKLEQKQEQDKDNSGNPARKPITNNTNDNNIINIPKVKFIIMKNPNPNSNPNLINIRNKKDLENPAPKPSGNNYSYNYDENEDDEDNYEDEEDNEDNEEEDEYDNYLSNLLEKYNEKYDYADKNDNKNDNKNDKKDKTKTDKNKKDKLDPASHMNDMNSFDTNFNNLFFNSILNRINNIDTIDSGCCSTNPPSNKQKNKGNKNKDDEDPNDNDNNDITLEYEWLGNEIKDIDDLIRVGKTYNPKKRKRHNLNLKKLNKLVDPLTELKNMIGMKEVKKIIFDQIIYYLQNLDDKNVDMLHTVIVGPPGVGKTQLTHIIAKIYNKLGFLKTDKVICAKRDDLIGEYIGQTAPKTRKILESALGGVLLLDEVYALSPNSEKDFAREAIDMINVYLSEHCHDLVCVIAGYKKPTYENFLGHNEGLARRFTHHFEIKGYDAEELTLIFKKYLEEQKWGLLSTVEEMKPIIEKHLKIFPNFGGDMTTLFACCKKTHSKRLLLIASEEELKNTKKKIHIDDIEKGIKLFIEIKTKGGEDIEDKDKYVHMYS